MFIHSLDFYVIGKAREARINASLQEVIQILCSSFTDIRHPVLGIPAWNNLLFGRLAILPKR
jgi:hypothetical protein